MKTSTRILMIISLIIVNIFILVLISGHCDNLIFKTIDAKTISGINYNNQNIKVFQTNDISNSKEILIKFKIKANSPNYFNNIFQISPNNSGIRMELLRSSVLSLYINAKNYDGYRHFELPYQIEMNKWYSVAINIDKNKHINILLDNNQLVSMYDSDLRYKISNISIGSGLNSVRPFNGEIKDFSISYKFYNVNSSAWAAINTIQLLLTLLTIFLAVYLIRHMLVIIARNNQEKNNESNDINPFINKRISIISSILLAGFVIAVIFHYALASYFKMNSYPYNTFVFWQVDAFVDFYRLVYDLCSNLNPYFELNGYYSSYLPLSFLVTYPFSLIPVKQVSFILCSMLFIFSFTFYNYLNLKAANKEGKLNDLFKNLVIFSFLSYPFLFCLDRGNIEWLVFILLASFVYYFSRKNYKISSVFLATAISLKIYPIIFISLFLIKKRYKDIFLTLFISFWLVIIPFLPLKGGFFHNVIGLIIGLANYKSHFIIDTVGIPYGTTIFGAIKIIMYKLDTYVPYYQIMSFVNLYSVFNLISTALMVIYLWSIEKTYWKQITVLFIACLAFMQVSADYRLMELFIPMWLFIRSQSKTNFDTIYCILFGLLLIPKNYIYLAPVQNVYASISVVLNPILMCLLLALIVFEGFEIKNSTVQE